MRKPAMMMEDKAAKGSSDLREGEIAVELPTRFDASLYYIGHIHTPWIRREDCPKNPRETEAVCTIVLDPRWVAGLQGLESVSHVVVLSLAGGAGAAAVAAAHVRAVAIPSWRSLTASPPSIKSKRNRPPRGPKLGPDSPPPSRARKRTKSSNLTRMLQARRRRS